MADELTPEQIQQARARALTVTTNRNECCHNELVLAYAVLDLAERVEKLDDEALKWTAIAGEHAEQVEVLTEQQPVEPWDIDLSGDTPLKRCKKCGWVLCGHLVHAAEQQPEPVSRDEIVDMFEAEFADAPTYAVVEQLLSRYTITRKPEGGDHGE